MGRWTAHFLISKGILWVLFSFIVYDEELTNGYFAEYIKRLWKGVSVETTNPSGSATVRFLILNAVQLWNWSSSCMLFQTLPMVTQNFTIPDCSQDGGETKNVIITTGPWLSQIKLLKYMRHCYIYHRYTNCIHALLNTGENMWLNDGHWSGKHNLTEKSKSSVWNVHDITASYS